LYLCGFYSISLSFLFWIFILITVYVPVSRYKHSIDPVSILILAKKYVSKKMK
jgi:hypothetical protein